MYLLGNTFLGVDTVYTALVLLGVFWWALLYVVMVWRPLAGAVICATILAAFAVLALTHVLTREELVAVHCLFHAGFYVNHQAKHGG